MGGSPRTIYPAPSAYNSTICGLPLCRIFALFLVSGMLAAGCGETGGSSPLSASGRIEVTEVGVSSKVGGRVVRLLAKEGDEVKAGQLLAVIEGEELEKDLLRIKAQVVAAEAKVVQVRLALEVERTRAATEIDQAKAALKAADEKWAMLKGGARREEIDEARAVVDEMKARMAEAELSLNRMQALFQDGAVAKQQLDQAEKEHEARKAQHRAAIERLRLFEAGYRQEEIKVAEAELERAKAGLRMAQANAAQVDVRTSELQGAEASLKEVKTSGERMEVQLQELQVFSALDGIIMTKGVEVGEVVPAGKSLFIIGDLGSPWIKVYIPAERMGHVRIGQKTRVKVDAFPKREFLGQVTWIASQVEFTPRNVQTKEERITLVYAVKIALPNEERLLRAGLMGDAEMIP
jgi:HlyD family secretion protein